MNIKQDGVMMCAPQRWNAAKVGNGSQLGWTWGDIGSGILSIGKWGINTFVSSQQTEAYKAIAEQQAKERADLVNLGLKAAAAVAIAVVVVNIVKGR